MKLPFGPRDEPLSTSEVRLARTTVYLIIFALTLPFILRYLFLGVVGLPKVDGGWAQTIGMSPQNAAALLSLSLLFLWSRPSLRSFRLTLLLGLIAEGLYIWNLPPVLSWYQKFLSFGGGLGVVCLLGMLHQGVFDRCEAARVRARTALRISVVLATFPLSMGALLGLLSAFTPLVYDGHGFIVEGSLGFYPSIEVARFLAGLPFLQALFFGIYSRLPLFVILGFILTSHLPRRCHFDLFQAYALAGLIVFPLYYILPMVGIDYFLGPKLFPFGPIPDYSLPQPVPANPMWPRSCMPSIHTTSILLSYWAIRSYSSKLKVAYGLLVVITLVSALDARIGHYFIDFIPAVPYSLACVAFSCKPSSRRPLRTCLLLGTTAYVGAASLALLIRTQATWLANHSVFTWSLFALIVAASWLTESKLSSDWIKEQTSSDDCS